MVESAVYAFSLNLKLFWGALFVGIAILTSVFRLKYVLNKLGTFVSPKTLLEYFLIANSSVFSFIKMSSTVSVYYLVKKGVFLSHAMTGFILERFFDFGLHLLVSALLIGTYSVPAVFALVFLVGFVLLFTRRFEWFSRWSPLKKLSDFKEELKKVLDFESFFVLGLFSLVIFILNSLAVSRLAGVGLFLGASVVALGGIVVGTSPTPIGLGVYEVVLPSFLVSQGVSPEVALGSILTYRFLTLWVPAIAGLFVAGRRL